MKLEIYPKLSTRSRRAMTRLFKPRFCKYRNRIMGKYYRYFPRGSLLERLGEEMGLTKSQVLSKIRKERIYLLRKLYPDVQFEDWEI